VAGRELVVTDPAVLFADVSSNDRAFNGHAYKSAGHKLIAIKATEGDQYVNPNHGAWAHAAHAAGLAVAHYCFCRPENGDPAGQAVHFWQTVQPHYLRGRDRLVFDVETDTPGNGSRWLADADSELLRHSGGTPSDQPIGYTFLSYFEQGRPELRSRAWWLAAWGPVLRERQPLAGGQYLWAQQYTNGAVGPEPHVFAGVTGPGPGGACDGSVLNKRSLYLIEQALGRKPPP
jgi:GH25 family lysozyme M1 (1,4-beta-N-acetylmuramidase)